MRYMNEVKFVNKIGERYDPELGEYVEADLIEKVLEVNVTDLGSDRSVVLFGDVIENAIVIRLQPCHEVHKFDYVVYDGKTYKLYKAINPRDRKTLIVKEFVNG